MFFCFKHHQKTWKYINCLQPKIWKDIYAIIFLDLVVLSISGIYLLRDGQDYKVKKNYFWKNVIFVLEFF